MRILTSADIHTLIQMREVIGLMREVFTEIGAGAVDMPQRSTIALHGGKDTVLFMPGYVTRTNTVGVKIVSVFPDNRVLMKVPTIHATVLLNDPVTGELAALMDGGYITALRTGAVSAIATDLLAVRDSSRLGVFGAGVQARSQIDGIMEVRPITSVRVYASNADRAHQLVGELRGAYGGRARFKVAASPDETVTDVDVVVTATTSTTPVFDGRLLAPGIHINAIGSFKPEHRELDDHTVRKARIFVDSRAAALSEAGDLIIPLRSSVIGPSAIEADLGELVLGKKQARTTNDDITLFKAVGLAVEDIVVAARVYAKAQASCTGIVI